VMQQMRNLEVLTIETTTIPATREKHLHSPVALSIKASHALHLRSLKKRILV
jgi:hypothetical protein